MSVADRIETKLRAALEPEHLQVINESHKHRGHAGSPGTGDSHFAVHIVAAIFAGQSRIARQRMVMAALAEELAGPVHALSIKAAAPDKPDQK